MRQADAAATLRQPTYKGNAGNLMQHWTLCETLGVVQRHAPYLSYVDAHAMAPVALCRNGECQTFDRVREGRRQGSVYERAWHRLAPEGKGYPNSAAFVRDVWPGRLSMLLCEIAPTTAAKLRAWAQGCPGATIIEGDWRKRFAKGLPDAPMTLLSFDPYMYNLRRGVNDAGNLYPCDLELTVRALDAVQGGVLIQLSTYSTQDGNVQEAVVSSVNAILAEGRLRPATVVRLDGRTMSLVYAREIDWLADLADLPRRFRAWLDRSLLVERAL